MASKMAEEGKYSDWDEDSDGDDLNHKGHDRGSEPEDVGSDDDITTTAALPPKDRLPARGGRTVLPPPRGSRPTNSGARNLARQKYAKPPFSVDPEAVGPRRATRFVLLTPWGSI